MKRAAATNKKLLIRRILEIADILGMTPLYSKVAFWFFSAMATFIMAMLAIDTFTKKNYAAWTIIITLLPNLIVIGLLFYWLGFSKTRIQAYRQNRLSFPNGFPWEASIPGRAFRILRILLACFGLNIIVTTIISGILIVLDKQVMAESYLMNWFSRGYFITVLVMFWPMSKMLR